MASGSINLTSYKAKQIVGSSIAASPAGALLFTGANYTGNTWIYHYGYGGTTNPWGIFHDTTAEKLIIKGSGTDSVWVKMDTGDTYILGKVGIGYDPNTAQNNYKLYVDGDIYFDDTTYLNGNVGIGYDPATSGNTYKLYVDGDIYADDTTYLNGKVGIGYDPNTTGNNYKLYVDGSAYFDIGTDSTSDLDFVINGSNAYLSFSGQGIKSFTSADANNTLFLNYNGGQTQIGGSGYLVGNVGIGYDPDTSGNTYKLRLDGGSTFLNSTTAASSTNLSSQLIVANTDGTGAAIELWRNGNASWQIMNNSGTLYIRNNWTTERQSTYSQNGLIMDYNTGAASLPYLALGQTTRNTSYKLYVNGTSYFSNDIALAAGKRVHGSGGALYLGNSDNASWLYVQDICSQNGNDKWKITVAGAATFASVVTISYKSGTWVNSLTSSAITLTDTAGSYGGWICGPTKNGRIAISTYQNSDDLLYIGYGERGRTTNSFTRSMTWNGANGRLTTASVANAIWNDYAECRISDTLEPGYCITETMEGKMIKTNERLMPGCKLISDTYGIIMGETTLAQTPIAVAGRVLAYPYRNRNDYPLGAAVCSAPGGTIDLMTRDEIIKYPERIVGTVSEIPNYEIWEAGEQGEKKILVNGRIWIYVK